ncbi:hypothetical protein FRAAL5102 [Frankia alni ACN14a]|uniref:Uncharacterized protein n=1 Tax=Frankia alni (strain DSM 45986 / CECT 9034 / ACN14a) TaxID=326424 RepID=Q0RFK1_FRAAA|nr:hypothetical protein FRAAL5102 [Frankia alni ACN14a]
MLPAGPVATDTARTARAEDTTDAAPTIPAAGRWERPPGAVGAPTGTARGPDPGNAG